MVNKINVIFCAPKTNVSGGISKWALFILDEFKTIDHVDFQHLEYERSSFIAYETFIKRVFLGIKDYSLFLLKIIRALLNFNSDVVYVTSSGSLGLIRDICILFLCKLFRIRYFIHFHFGRIPFIFKNNSWEKSLILFVVKFSEKVIVLDHHSLLVLSKYNRNIEYLPNPLSNQVKKYVDSPSNVKRNQRSILFVGEMLKSKGVFDLLEACKDLINIELVFVGLINEKTRDEILRFNQYKKLDWIVIKGFLDHKDVINEMLKCSVFAFPSHTEGFPNVIIEAMYCQCSIISSDVGEIPVMLDVKSNNPSGICTQVRNVNDLKTKINYFLENQSISKKFGKNARERVLKEYDMPIVCEKLKSLLIG